MRFKDENGHRIESPYIKASRKVSTLERRLAHLKRLEVIDGRTDLSFIKAEISALEWAIPVLNEAGAKLRSVSPFDRDGPTSDS